MKEYKDGDEILLKAKVQSVSTSGLVCFVVESGFVGTGCVSDIVTDDELFERAMQIELPGTTTGPVDASSPLGRVLEKVHPSPGSVGIDWRGCSAGPLPAPPTGTAEALCAAIETLKPCDKPIVFPYPLPDLTDRVSAQAFADKIKAAEAVYQAKLHEEWATDPSPSELAELAANAKYMKEFTEFCARRDAGLTHPDETCFPEAYGKAFCEDPQPPVPLPKGFSNLPPGCKVSDDPSLVMPAESSPPLVAAEFMARLEVAGVRIGRTGGKSNSITAERLRKYTLAEIAAVQPLRHVLDEELDEYGCPKPLLVTEDKSKEA